MSYTTRSVAAWVFPAIIASPRCSRHRTLPYPSPPIANPLNQCVRKLPQTRAPLFCPCLHTLHPWRTIRLQGLLELLVSLAHLAVALVPRAELPSVPWAASCALLLSLCAFGLTSVQTHHTTFGRLQLFVMGLIAGVFATMAVGVEFREKHAVLVMPGVVTAYSGLLFLALTFNDMELWRVVDPFMPAVSFPEVNETLVALLSLTLDRAMLLHLLRSRAVGRFLSNRRAISSVDEVAGASSRCRAPPLSAVMPKCAPTSRQPKQQPGRAHTNNPFVAASSEKHPSHSSNRLETSRPSCGPRILQTCAKPARLVSVRALHIGRCFGWLQGPTMTVGSDLVASESKRHLDLFDCRTRFRAICGE